MLVFSQVQTRVGRRPASERRKELPITADVAAAGAEKVMAIVQVAVAVHAVLKWT